MTMTMTRYPGVKDITKLVSLPGPGKGACVGVIDSDKGTIMDVINRLDTSLSLVNSFNTDL